MAEELFVSAVNMKTLARNVDSLTAMLQSPAFRGSNPISALRSGAMWSGIKPHEAPVYTWPMWVLGCNPDGSIPNGYTRRRKFYENVDQLTALFQGSSSVSIFGGPLPSSAPQPGLVRVRHFLPDGTDRVADCEVISAQNFAVDGYGDPLGRFTVELQNPFSYWRSNDLITALIDVNRYTENSGGDYENETGEIDTKFAGATAPLDDASVRLYGPLTNPRLLDGNTQGTYFQYLGTLNANQAIQIDMRPYTVTSIGSQNFPVDYGAIRTRNTLGRLFRLRPGRYGGYRMHLNTDSGSDSGYAQLIGYKKFMVG